MRTLCTRCLRAQNACFCAQVQPIELPFLNVILMHPLEFRSKTGTGRMSYLSVKKSRLICDIDFSQNTELENLLQDSTYAPYLIYPGPLAQKVNDPHFKFPEGKTPALLFIDATWPCAKKMLKLSPNLQKLPRLSFCPPSESLFKFKRQPVQECLSTLESLYYLCQELKLAQQLLFQESYEELLTPFKWMVNYQIQAQNDPQRSHYRKQFFKGDRNLLPKAQRWQHRPVFFTQD